MWFFALLERSDKMSYIKVKDVYKTFKVVDKQSGLKTSIKTPDGGRHMAQYPISIFKKGFVYLWLCCVFFAEWVFL